MKLVTPAERREALKAFIEVPDDDNPLGLTVVDRSTLERAGVCPFQAKAISDGRCRTVNAIAEVGNETHRCFGEIIRNWIDSRGNVMPYELRQDLELAAMAARPDLQPDTLRAVRAASYDWSRLVFQIHPSNILAFDGGEDIDRGGQLAIDFPDLGVRYTSEVDLLYQSDVPEVIDEVDYKTGWADYSTENIRDSFQFQSHAALVFDKYPEKHPDTGKKGPEALRVRVFSPRRHSLSYGVYFHRKHVHEWKVRIRSTIDAWKLTLGDNPPCWPTLEKCCDCPAAALCPVADQITAEVAGDPSAVLKQYIATEAKSKALAKALTSYVDSRKQPIIADGQAFGRVPAKEPTAKVYKVSSPTSE